VYDVVGLKRDPETVVENRKLDYELLQRWIKYMEKPTDKYKYKEAWQAMMKRTLAAAAAGGGRGGRGGATPPPAAAPATAPAPATKVEPDPCNRSRAGRPRPESMPATPTAPGAPSTPPVAGGGGGGRRGGGGAAGGGNAEVKKLADEFQENVIKVMLVRKDLNEENEVIIAKSLDGTKKRNAPTNPTSLSPTTISVPTADSVSRHAGR
jgi:hypothetical protein